MKMPTPRWEFGTILYQRVDTENGGIVTGYNVRPGGGLTYLLTWGTAEESAHYEFELTDERVYSTTKEND